MLTRDAQPTSTAARHIRRSLSAAGGALAALALILLPLALSEDSAAAASGSGAWPWPLLGEVITPYRNGSDPYAAGQHRGLDIAAPAGSPVLAIVGGRVSFSGRLPDGGETVTVASADGTWLVSDLHLSERAVSRGAIVRAGELLGKVGTTGKRSAARPHLHLSVRRADSRAYVDPTSLLGPQRLPEAPEAPAQPVAVARPAAGRAATGQVKVSPLESGGSDRSNVHAQSVGDSKPATRHGAQTGSTPARRSAGSPAREGHAADQATGRVAPPPLAAPRRVAESATPVASENRPAAHTPRHDRSPRWMLLTIAATCLVALVMRRRPVAGPASPGRAPAGAGEEGQADVIEIAGRRRSA